MYVKVKKEQHSLCVRIDCKCYTHVRDKCDLNFTQFKYLLTFYLLNKSKSKNIFFIYSIFVVVVLIISDASESLIIR